MRVTATVPVGEPPAWAILERHLFDRLSCEQVEQLADILGTVLDGLVAESGADFPLPPGTRPR